MIMADEFNERQVFLPWAESAAVLQTDASQGIARAQRLLAMRCQCGRGVPKGGGIAFYWMQVAAQQNYSTAQSRGALRKRLGYCAGQCNSVSLVWSRSTERRFHGQRTFASLNTVKHMM